MSRPIIYVSVDIEADGPIPGMYSMLAFGAAAFRDPVGNPNPRGPMATFEANLKPMEGAGTDPDTMEWWKTQPDAWAYVTSNQQDPAAAMPAFRKWLLALPGKPVVVGYPVTFDFMFIYWYMVKYTSHLGPVPFGFQGMDIKTQAASQMGVPFPQATKKNMPKRWFDGTPRHTHQALDDALGQGILLMNMLIEGTTR